MEQEPKPQQSGEPQAHMKTNWRYDFFIASCMVCFVITLLTIVISILDERRSESGDGLLARALLLSSQLELESSLRSMEPDFPVERLISTPAYQNHLAKVTAAAKALESYDKSERQKRITISTLFIITMLTYVIAERLFKRWSATQSEETPKQAE